MEYKYSALKNIFLKENGSGVVVVVGGVVYISLFVSLYFFFVGLLRRFIIVV